MSYLAQCFAQHLTPPTVPQLSDAVGVPTRLAQRILDPLLQSRLVVEIAGMESAYAPARPLNKISFKDILDAMRCQGPALAMPESDGRAQVQGELDKVRQIEQAAAAAITLEQLAAAA
jgi:DNA-binding IscR family transcriptional regulator